MISKTNIFRWSWFQARPSTFGKQRDLIELSVEELVIFCVTVRTCPFQICLRDELPLSCNWNRNKKICSLGWKLVCLTVKDWKDCNVRWVWLNFASSPDWFSCNLLKLLNFRTWKFQVFEFWEAWSSQFFGFQTLESSKSLVAWSFQAYERLNFGSFKIRFINNKRVTQIRKEVVWMVISVTKRHVGETECWPTRIHDRCTLETPNQAQTRHADTWKQKCCQRIQHRVSVRNNYHSSRLTKHRVSNYSDKLLLLHLKLATFYDCEISKFLKFLNLPIFILLDSLKFRVLFIRKRKRKRQK